jgi:hypothetical protein
VGSNEEKTRTAEAAQPSRNPSDILKIRVLSVLLVLTLIAFAFYVAVTADIFDDEPPYPSETTPLTIRSWGITWDWGDANVSDLSVCRFEYDNMSYDFDIYDVAGSGSISGRSGPFVVGEFIDLEDFVVPETLEEAEELSHLSWVSFWEDGVEMNVIDCYFVSDHTNSLEFNRGDSISFVHLVYADGVLSSTGFQEGPTYEISLKVFENAEFVEEGYGFAVDGGDLYSWVDHGDVDDPLS